MQGRKAHVAQQHMAQRPQVTPRKRVRHQQQHGIVAVLGRWDAEPRIARGARRPRRLGRLRRDRMRQDPLHIAEQRLDTGVAVLGRIARHIEHAARPRREQAPRTRARQRRQAQRLVAHDDRRVALVHKAHVVHVIVRRHPLRLHRRVVAVRRLPPIAHGTQLVLPHDRAQFGAQHLELGLGGVRPRLLRARMRQLARQDMRHHRRVQIRGAADADRFRADMDHEAARRGIDIGVVAIVVAVRLGPLRRAVRARYPRLRLRLEVRRRHILRIHKRRRMERRVRQRQRARLIRRRIRRQNLLGGLGGHGGRRGGIGHGTRRTQLHAAARWRACHRPITARRGSECLSPPAGAPPPPAFLACGVSSIRSLRRVCGRSAGARQRRRARSSRPCSSRTKATTPSRSPSCAPCFVSAA